MNPDRSLFRGDLSVIGTTYPGKIDKMEPGRTKIIVKFKNFELPKKLVFRHDKLALAS